VYFAVVDNDYADHDAEVYFAVVDNDYADHDDDYIDSTCLSSWY
jgi:hypothetical protein